MSRYDSRSSDPSSYRDRKSDSGLGGGGGGGGSGGYEGRYSSSSKREKVEVSSPKKFDLDGLTHFEKNFYAESSSVASMTEEEVEEYRIKRQITVEGKDVPKPVKEFGDIGFPGSAEGWLKAPIIQGGEDAKLKPKGVFYHSRSLQSTSFEETVRLGGSDGEVKGNAVLVRKPKTRCKETAPREFV